MAKFTAEMLTRPQQKGAFVGTMAVLGTRMRFLVSTTMLEQEKTRGARDQSLLLKERWSLSDCLQPIETGLRRESPDQIEISKL